MRKYVPVPTAAISDQRLSDAELRLLINLIAIFDNKKFSPTSDMLSTLAISKRTFYRLSDQLVRCQYMMHTAGTSEYSLSLSILAKNSAKDDIRECQDCQRENEEERSKEEDKEYIYNNTLSDSNSSKVPENEKEKEIQKKEKDESEEVPERFSAEYREIIDYLNEKTGKKFSARSRVNQGHMSARLKEGFTVDDFKKVIDIKWFQWHDDVKMAKFLRPETLFGTKFDRYLNEDKAVRRVSANGWEYLQTEETNFMDEILGASDG